MKIDLDKLNSFIMWDNYHFALTKIYGCTNPSFVNSYPIIRLY
jgi:hypothetical protein